MSGIRDPLGGLNKPVVSYFYDEDLGNFQYGVGHPMKPFRVKMTDEMIKAYGMDEKMKRMHVEQDFIDNVDFTVFHSDDYVDVLKNLVPEDKDKYADQINRCKLISYYKAIIQLTLVRIARFLKACTNTARYILVEV